MIFLFTDFGLEGPYVGQMKAVLARHALGVPVIDLMHDVPPFDAESAAYLLAAVCRDAVAGDVVLGVVDPGVGSDREAVVIRADRRWYVGPDNGLFTLVARRAASVEAWAITWRPDVLSTTFHGRDLFAPVAARLACGDQSNAGLEPLDLAAIARPDWADDLARIIAVDRYGNAVTGLRAAAVPPDAAVHCAGTSFPRAATFAAVAPGAVFAYENSSGLIEIAANQASAAALFDLRVGQSVAIGPA